MNSTQDEIKDAKSDTANTLISKIDQSLESYPWLNEWQKEVIRWIETKALGAIESITPEIMTIITEKGRFELPLENTEHEDLGDMMSKSKYDSETNTIDSNFKYEHDYNFHDARRIRNSLSTFFKVKEHKYHSIQQVKRYIRLWDSPFVLSLDEVESIMSIMPAWDYKYGTRCKSVKEFSILLWLTDDDRSGRLDPSDKGHLDKDNRTGWVWLGSHQESRSGKDTMLRILFNKDQWFLNFEGDCCLFPARLLNSYIRKSR